MRIGDFARLANVSVRAVRFYDQTGLLTAIDVDVRTGYRQYDIRQLYRIRQIRAFQDLGFSLKEIREILRADLPHGTVRARMHERKSQIERRIRDDVGRLKRIEIYLGGAAIASNAHSSIDLRDTNDSWVLSLRAKLQRYDQAEEMFGELERKVPPRLLTGQRVAFWHSCESTGGPIDCEVVRYVKEPVSAPRGFNSYRLPTIKVASIFHCGDDDSIGESYAALTQWLASNDFQLRGAKREVYWPDSHSKNAQCITEIQFPVTRVPARRQAA